MNRNRRLIAMTTAKAVWSCLLCVALWSAGSHSHAQEKPDAAKAKATTSLPDIRELWVPSEELDAVLKKYPRAVMLTREQYDALLRDSLEARAEDKAEEDVAPPAEMIVRNVVLSGELHAEVAVIRADYEVEVFVDKQWTEIPLVLPRERLAKISVDGDGVGAVRSMADDTKDSPLQLLVRGRGAHRVAAEYHLPVQRGTDGKSITLTNPGIAAARLDLLLADGIELDSDLPFAVSEDGKLARFAFPAEQADYEIRWAAGNIAPIEESAIFQTCTYLYSIDSARVQGDLGLVLHSHLRDLPVAVAIALPPEVRVLSVEGSELLRWDRGDDGVVRVEMVEGRRRAADLRLLVEAPVELGAGQAAEITLPAAEVVGVHRASGTLALIGSDDVKVQSVETGRLTVPVLDELAAEIRTHPNFVNGFRFPVLSGAPVVTLSPVTQRFNGQLDTRVELMRDAIYVQRDLTVVPLEGRIFETRIDLPAGEEVVAVRWQNPTVGTHAHSLVMPDGPEWDRLPTADGEPVGLRIAWPGGLLAGGGRALVIESRRDPENWFSLGAEAVDLKFASATIYKAEAVSGYLAVAFDESFRIETADVSGLEARDARATPVKGRLAWFHLRDYALDLRAARRAPEFDAVLTSYLGPLQSSLEIEGQLDLDIRFAPLAELVVQAPTAVAALMRFDSPLIASKSLDEETGRWTLKFHRELLGEQRLRFHCSVPFEMAESEGDDAAAADGDGEEHFAVQVPVLKIDGVQRLRGQWLVEANTDTALSFEAEGLDEIDLLLASHVEGYQPRHRVIAAYDFRGTEHSLKLSGTRHEAAELLSTVIDDLQIDSVLSTDGLDRHQARIKLRTAGEQFLELGLPSGAELWTLTLDGEAVKPVTSSAGTLRIGLPADAGGRAEVEIKVVYQLRREEWGGSGRRELQPVLLSKSVPVLHSEWRLHLPEGFDYQKFRSNLRERFEVVDRTLLGQAAEAMGEMGSAAADGWTNYSVVDSRAADESFGDDDWKMDAAAAEPNAMPASRATVLASDGGNTGIYENERKLKEIILPTVDFDDTPLSSALEFLSQKSAELDTTEADPAKHGLNIILSAGNGGIGAPAPASGGMGFDDPAAPDFSSGSSVGETKITLKLTNVPLVEALRYTTSLANLKYKVEPHAVVIVPLSSPDADLYTNVYQVPPSFLNSSGAFGGGGGGPVDPFAPAADSGGALHSRTTAKQVLEQAGVTFGEGSSAIYNAATSQLIIRSTGDQMELVEAMIDSIKHSGGDVPQPNFMPLVAGDELTAEDLGAFRDLYENELAFRDSVNSGNSMEQRAIGAVEQRLMQSIVSNVDFENTPLSDALSLLSQQTGVPISLGDEVAHRAAVGFDNEGEVGQTKITLKLSNVPAIEALRYTTSLAGLKWRATPDGVEVVPRHTPDTNLKTLVVEVPPNVLSMGIDDSPLTARDLLERAGVTFPPGAGAAYNRSTQRLAVKTSEDQLELVEAYFASMDYVVDRGGSDALKTLMRGAEGNGVVGLIPIDFELPEAGRVYRFEGLFAPEPLRFRYVNWERQVRVAWWWILVGAVAFVMVALRWRRPWFLGLMGALVLGFLPKALLPSLMAVCNALMIGWLGALGLLVVWRVAGMLHRWHRREALRLAAGSVRSDVGGEEVAS